MKYSGKALTIAGSDSGGGAGIQADIKTFQAFNVYGTSVITAITAQNTFEIKTIHEIPSVVVGLQIDAVLQDIGADAVKTGMLFSQGIIEIVADRMNHYKVKKLVVDPVMISKANIRLLTKEAEESLIKKIIPLSLIITPNIYEAEVLSGIKINDFPEVEKAAKIIFDLGPKNVLIKGGHLERSYSTDILYDGANYHYFKSERINTDNTHGLGCTLSSAITANLASGKSLLEAIDISKKYIYSALREAKQKIGRGKGPLFHNINILTKEH